MLTHLVHCQQKKHNLKLIICYEFVGVGAVRKTHFSSNGNLPNARTISLRIHITNSNASTKHSHLLMAFGQFTDHDMTLSPETGEELSEPER